MKIYLKKMNSIKSSFEVPLENLEPTISNHSSIDSSSTLEVNTPQKKPVE